MASTFCFLERPGLDESEVLSWFRREAAHAEEIATPSGKVLIFRHLGPLAKDPAGELDKDNSPVVTIIPPSAVRGILWTVGEVHFWPTKMRSKFPELARLQSKFSTWLKSFPLIYENRRGAEDEFEYAYYLEGSCKNWNDGMIYALGSGMAALQKGQYFVSPKDNEFVLDTICRKLRLRGVDCDLP